MRKSTLLLVAVATTGCHLAIDAQRHLSDAGVDSGDHDAGDHDAGRVDAAGADGGQPDAGPGEEVIAELVAGFRTTCLRTTRGRLWCWGWNLDRQVGGPDEQDREAPLLLDALTDVIAVAPGSRHTCAAVGAGEVRCWGNNEEGQLGDGTRTSSPAPMRVRTLSGVTQLAAGYDHTCAIHDGGRVSCWGDNQQGQLGDGTSDDALQPTPFGSLTDAIAVSAGETHTCALRSGGTVLCAGSDFYGQQGDGAGVRPSAVPLPVEGIADARALDAGRRHTCALTGSGLRCWGFNFLYQCGTGDNADAESPRAALPFADEIDAVTAGGTFSCALGREGAASKVWCWGENSRFQIGRGVHTDFEPTPQEVSALSGVDGVTAGGEHACAWRGREAWCWGSHLLGESGVGDIIPEEAREVTPILWP